VGYYRYLLACCVVIEHLGEGIPQVSHAGMFAVFGFYVLSGYLMTKVLNDVYGFAFVPFWSNRILRLYPPYLFFLVIGLALIFGTAHAADFFPAVWKSRPDLSDWIGIVAVFPMGVAPMGWLFRPVPSIWSVGVELLNYAALYTIMARHKQVALAVAVGAAAYHVVSLWRGDNWGERYFPFHAALLPFSLGALIYFHTRFLTSRVSARVALLMCAPLLANGIIAGLLGGVQQTAQFETFFYLNLACHCLAVTALSLIAPGPPCRTSKRFSAICPIPFFFAIGWSATCWRCCCSPNNGAALG
jgi:peptidoglycan/LPS O-acetylase OafA/YrhL